METVGPFRKSTFSGPESNCIEVAPLAGGGKAVRDSKDQSGPVLCFDAVEWSAFVQALKADEWGD